MFYSSPPWPRNIILTLRNLLISTFGIWRRDVWFGKIIAKYECLISKYYTSHTTFWMPVIIPNTKYIGKLNGNGSSACPLHLHAQARNPNKINNPMKIYKEITCVGARDGYFYKISFILITFDLACCLVELLLRSTFPYVSINTRSKNLSLNYFNIDCFHISSSRSRCTKGWSTEVSSLWLPRSCNVRITAFRFCRVYVLYRHMRLINLVVAAAVAVPLRS